jgi:hypothetical protein
MQLVPQLMTFDAKRQCLGSEPVGLAIRRLGRDLGSAGRAAGGRQTPGNGCCRSTSRTRASSAEQCDSTPAA